MPLEYYSHGIASTASGGSSIITSNNVISTIATTTVAGVRWVDSADTRATDAATAGTEERPLATLEYAVDNATAGQIIVVKATHTENLVAPGAGPRIALDVAGVKIFGLGTGTARATFTPTTTGAVLNAFGITAADVEIHNLRFAASTVASWVFIDVNALRAVISNCGFTQPHAVASDDAITITASGSGSRIENCTFAIATGTTAANRPLRAISIESATALGIVIDGNSFNGATSGWDEGAINSTAACTEFWIRNNTFSGGADVRFTGLARGLFSNNTLSDGSRIIGPGAT